MRSAMNRAALVQRDSSDPAFPQHGAGPALACGRDPLTAAACVSPMIA
ncbi:hypothetical protein BCPG_02302 [Burkholderia cenocepacia PC184]|nr:hypothetical protein BCPG_02302 [Burkholderia cenocepacia PC184]